MPWWKVRSSEQGTVGVRVVRAGGGPRGKGAGVSLSDPTLSKPPLVRKW